MIGIDRSEPMLDAARELDREAGLRVEYRVARAEVTGLPAASAEIVSAGQCWYLFDRPHAAREVARLLVPGGRAAICQLDWCAEPGNLVAETERLIGRHHPEWNWEGGANLYAEWPSDLEAAGLAATAHFTYDEPVWYTPEGWRGRMRASAGIGASLSPERVQAFDRELASLLAERFPGGRISIPHRVTAVVATRGA